MSEARIIDGKAVAAEVRARVAKDVTELAESGLRPPGLATVLVGDDEASAIYVRRKREACEEVGIRSIHLELAAAVAEDELLAALDGLAEDEEVSGILVQLPLPDGLDRVRVIERIPPAKDVDGLTPVNAGLLAQGTPGLVPCTPAGVMELLRSAGVTVAGAEVVVVGRSNLVGRPLVSLLLAADATVTVCHTRTADLGEVCRRAEILVAAAGSPKLITAEMVRPGATVIDVGMNRGDGGGLVGDVDFDPVREVAGAITPVPGGVGPMTIAMLLVNTVSAARAAGEGGAHDRGVPSATGTAQK